MARIGRHPGSEREALAIAVGAAAPDVPEEQVEPKTSPVFVSLGVRRAVNVELHSRSTVEVDLHVRLAA